MRSIGSPVIAVCGKGGVGKTSISAMLVRHFAENPDIRVLAVDADPAVGLATALGIDVSRTVDDIRNETIRRVSSGEKADKAEMLAMLDYEMLAALKERKNLAFLAIGRPESEGCYCQVNHILKDVIASVARNFDYVIIDGEAGIEQVNRRVMEKVSHLILASDASVKSINAAAAINRAVGTSIDCARVGLVFNRIRSEEEYVRLTLPAGIDVLGWLPEDEQIRTADMEGSSLMDLHGSPVSQALVACVSAMGINNKYESSNGTTDAPESIGSNRGYSKQADRSQ